MRQINDPNQFAAVFKTLNGLVRQLDEYRSNAKNIENLFSRTLNEQRLKLRVCCEKVLFETMSMTITKPAAAVATAKVVGAAKKIEELLWQKIFYDTIATGKKLKSQLTANESYLLNSHIHSAIGYYHHLLMKLLNCYRRDAIDVDEEDADGDVDGGEGTDDGNCSSGRKIRSGRRGRRSHHRYDEIVVRDWQEPKLDFMYETMGGGGDQAHLDNDGLADVDDGDVTVPSSTSTSAAKSTATLAIRVLVRYLIYRVLLCLGDLNRYKLAFTIEPSALAAATNRRIAIDFYTKAANCCPDYGMPFNQIASLVSDSLCSLDTVYFYLRSLNCRVQFNGSEGNLLALYEKKQQLQQQQSDGASESSNVGEISHFLNLFQLWILGLFFERNEQKSSASAVSTGNGTDIVLNDLSLKKTISMSTNRDHRMLEEKTSSPVSTARPTLEELLKSFDKCLDFVRESPELAAAAADHLNDEILVKIIAISEFVAVKLLLAKKTKIVVERIEQFLLAVWTKLVKRSLQQMTSFNYCRSTASGGSSNGGRSSGATSANNTSSSSTSNSSSPLSVTMTGSGAEQQQQPWLKSIKMLSDWFLSRSTLRDENLRGTEQFSLAKQTSLEFARNLFQLFNSIRTQSIVSGVNIMDVETAEAVDEDAGDDRWIVAAVTALDDENIDDYPVSEDFLLKNTMVFERYRDRYVAIRWFYYDDDRCCGGGGGSGDCHEPVSFSLRFDNHLRLLKLLALGKLFVERVFQQVFRYDCETNRFVSIRPVKENVKTTSDKQLMESMGQLWIEAEIKELEHQIETSRYSSPILIVDANAFVNHFSIVKYLVSTRRYVIIVPNAVLGVLDEQKLQSIRVREMIRWLEKTLCDGNRFIRAQRAQEKLPLPLLRYPRQQRRGKNYRHYANAIGIAECCNYFVSQKDSSSLMVTLLYDYGGQNCCSTSTKNDLIALAKSIEVRSELITFFYESLRNIKQRKF